METIMPFDLTFINEQLSRAPAEFILACEKDFDDRVEAAAAAICDNLKYSPIVLLSGPSGSGKTTTAKKIEAVLDRRGVSTHTISMDNYFRNVDPETAPKTETGQIDYESPDCLDMELIGDHFFRLSNGGEIMIPRFDFSLQERVADKFDILKLRKDEIVIFEGIHALNDGVTQDNGNAFKLFVSAHSSIAEDGTICFHNSWLRLVRRVVRDRAFRGAAPVFTLNLWSNVLRGEKRYIYPNLDKTDFFIDSALPYEVGVMKHYAEPLLRAVPKGKEHYGELDGILSAFSLFSAVEPAFVPVGSILREFIGGGIY